MEALLPEMAKRIKAVEGGITINNRDFPEVLTAWVTVVRARLNQIVNEHAISIDERPSREKYVEKEAEFEIKRLKLILLNIANNPRVSGLRCICNVAHGWNVTTGNSDNWKNVNGSPKYKRGNRAIKVENLKLANYL